MKIPKLSCSDIGNFTVCRVKKEKSRNLKIALETIVGFWSNFKTWMKIAKSFFEKLILKKRLL
jgi:hypothetical protein